MGISRYLSYSAESKINITKINVTKINVTKNHILSGIFTFISFVCVGILPLIPFLLLTDNRFESSVILTMSLFVIIGYIKAKFLNTSMFKSIFETFCLGASASLISYYIGYNLKNKINI